MTLAWEQEKMRFFKAFKTYMLDSVKKSKNQTAYMKKAKDGTVLFEFLDEKGNVTTKSFGDDMIFSYKLAIESIYDFTKKNRTIQIRAYENYARIKVIEP